MTGELNLYGIYVPWGLVMALVAIIVARIIGYFLARTGFYRFVWHPALFDFAIFIIVMGCFLLITSLRGT